MLNFLKISRQIKMLSIQGTDFNRSVRMEAIYLYYSGSIFSVPTNEQFLVKKRTGAQFQRHILKTERLLRVYTCITGSRPIQKTTI